MRLSIWASGNQATMGVWEGGINLMIFKTLWGGCGWKDQVSTSLFRSKWRQNKEGLEKNGDSELRKLFWIFCAPTSYSYCLLLRCKAWLIGIGDMLGLSYLRERTLKRGWHFFHHLPTLAKNVTLAMVIGTWVEQSAIYFDLYWS